VAKTKVKGKSKFRVCLIMKIDLLEMTYLNRLEDEVCVILSKVFEGNSEQI